LKTSIRLTAPIHSDRHLPSWCTYQFGKLPLLLFLPLFALVVGLTFTHTLTSDITSMVAALAVGGFTCAWLGGLFPPLRRLGAPAIVAAFLPSYLVYRHWLPINFVQAVTTFTRQTNFIYLYITAIIVGSIFSMNRTLLLRGMAKICVPLLAGSALAFLLGSVASIALGMPMHTSIPMVLVPIMAGGVGEGAIPLSIGYAEIFHQDPAQLLSHLLPVVLFANFVAIVLAGCLNTLGLRYPSLTGNGLLQAPDQRLPPPTAQQQKLHLTPDLYLSALLFAIALYLASVLAHRWVPLPAPVTMLILAVLLKIANLIPPSLEAAAAAVSSFFAMAVTYPLLFAVAIALTPWSAVRESLHPANLLLITLAVLTLTLTGFFVGRLLHLFPIESALINACHTGAGGTGDVAILTAAERLELMPFAQVATRIGGAITVTLTLLLLRWLAHGRS
jgi:malate:Na+ symporter